VRPPWLVQALLFGALASIGKVFGYTAAQAYALVTSVPGGQHTCGPASGAVLASRSAWARVRQRRLLAALHHVASSNGDGLWRKTNNAA